MRTSDAVDGSRSLNAKVLAGLHANAIVYDGRRTGKTITLLTYIAATTKVTDIHRPIVVCESSGTTLVYRHMWHCNFPDLPEPRWMGWRQFLRAEGLTGDVYFEEPRESWPMCRLIAHAKRTSMLAQGRVAGVTSRPF